MTTQSFELITDSELQAASGGGPLAEGAMHIAGEAGKEIIAHKVVAPFIDKLNVNPSTKEKIATAGGALLSAMVPF